MPKLILIKHASPQVVPGEPPERWVLSENGRASCAPLTERVAAHSPQIIVSSDEPKAMETAKLLAEQLKIPCQSGDDLHEHDRSNVPHMRSSEFIASMELFFRKPDELVLGRETGNQAEERFTSAIDELLEQHSDKTLAVVSHGTVIALLLSRLSDRSAFQLWRDLGLPSFAVLDLPEFDIEEIVPRIG